MGAQLAIKLLSFSFSILVVRHLGAEAYGQYAAVLAFGALFIVLADLGLGPYAVREVARARAAADAAEKIDTLYGNVLALRLLLSLVSALLLILAAWLTDRPLVMVGAIALGALGLVMYSAQGTCDSILAGFERLDLSAAARVANQLIFVVAGAAALWFGAGYYGLVVASLLGIALMSYLCWRAVSRLGARPRHLVLVSWPSLLRASVPFGVIGLTLGLSYKFDSVLLNIFRGDAETGYYSAAYNLVFSAAILSNVVNTALYPSLTRQAASAPETLPKIYARALRYLMMIALPIAVGAWTLADQIVPFLFGDEYLPAIPALQIVIWVLPLMFASELLGYIAVVSGREARAARAVMVSTALNVVLNLLVVPRLGFLGAAVMTLVTEAVLVGQYLWLLRATAGHLDWRQVLHRPLLAALLMGSLVVALRDLPLLVNVVLGALTYAGLLTALRAVGHDERQVIRELIAGYSTSQAAAVVPSPVELRRRPVLTPTDAAR